MISFFRTIFSPPRDLILVVAAFGLGLSLAENRAERHSISKGILENLVYCSLFGYILGGRLLYALSNFSAFAQSPLNLFSLNLDLFDPAAALLAAVVVGLICGSRQKLPLWLTLDALTPLFAAISIGLALSHFAAGTAFGSPTNLPWGVNLWNATRHPSQVYELIASSLIFAIMWFRKIDSLPGVTFLVFAALTASTRLFLEAFRGDSTLIFGSLRLAQIIAWMVLTGSILASEIRRKQEKTD